MDKEHMEELYWELSSLEDRGISIWLEGSKSNPEYVAKELCIHEDNTYMRDYVFDEGVLQEIHFDKISKNNK